MASSRLVEQCSDAPNRLDETIKITFFWVAGHSGIGANERADRLTKQDSSLDSPPRAQFRCQVKSEFYPYYLTATDCGWRTLTTSDKGDLALT